MCANLLEELTEAFASNRLATGRAIREPRESDPRAFRDGAVHVLRTSPESPGSKYLPTVLVVQPDFNGDAVVERFTMSVSYHIIYTAESRAVKTDVGAGETTGLEREA